MTAPRFGAGLGLAVAVLACGTTAPVFAQAYASDDRTSVYASSGVNLPAPQQTFGQDEVQAAGGVACRSSVSSGGPYIDAGVVGSQDLFGRQVTTGYVRLVTPLGRRPGRVDCTRLYDLEIQRLQLELELARMNLPPRDGVPADAPARRAAGFGTRVPAPAAASVPAATVAVAAVAR